MGEISTGAQSVARTPMYALAGNCRFCPADPMKKAPTAVLNSLHHCWGPNWHKTTLKKDVPHVGTLADDLSCPVQPPSLVQPTSTRTVLYCTVLYCTVLYCTVLYCTVLYCTVLYCHKCYLFLDRLRVRGCSVCPSRFRGLPQDVAVPSRFRRRESVEKIQM